MAATKILWGQILAVLLLVLTGIWSATQWTAAALGYQPELGAPWFALLGWPVYRPYSFFWWWFSYDAYAPHVFNTGGLIAVTGGFASIIVAIGMSVWRARELKTAATYGTARWANRQEIREAGLLDDKGVVLGQFNNQYLRHDGPEHVLCFAPTRSGKGVGLVIPTLLTWPGSAIVHDIKGENWTLTAGYRSSFSRVLLFDPTNAESAAYNPLLEVRRGVCEVRDVQNVADVLVDPEGSLEKRNHWEKTSHSLLVGAILHVLYAEANKTLAGVAAFLSDPKRSFESTLAAMMMTPHLDDDGVHPVVASAARELLNKSENERSGVLSTAMSFLGLYRDPVVAQVTQALIAQAQRMAFDVQDIQTKFGAQYKNIDLSASQATLVQGAEARWQNSVAAFEDALKVQAGVVGNIEGTREAVNSLLSASQSASGALQAAQAGNQLLAVQSQQLADLTATLASMGRAQSLDAANSAAAKAQAREQLRRFLAPGRGYVAGNARMFGN